MRTVQQEDTADKDVQVNMKQAFDTCKRNRSRIYMQGVQGISEWRNIPSVITQAFLRLANQVKDQNIKIEELQKSQGQLVQQQEFVSALANKVSLQEHRLKSDQVLVSHWQQYGVDDEANER